MPIPPFQAFLEEHRTLVYRFLLASVGPQDADDCFQETFLSALRAYPKLRNGDNLRSWILTIATRKAIDAGRSRRRRPVSVGDPEEAAVASGVDHGEATGTSGAVDREEPLWRTVRALPARQRAALVHRHVLDRSYADIARAMGTSEEAARANVYQAVKRLRRELSDEEDV
jgi:RNA polymerase sigma factor (sigma-70 family)